MLVISRLLVLGLVLLVVSILLDHVIFVGLAFCYLLDLILFLLLLLGILEFLHVAKDAKKSRLRETIFKSRINLHLPG